MSTPNMTGILSPRPMKRISVLSTVFVLGLAAPANAADVSGITAQDYYAAAYFQSAQEHPQIKAANSKKKQIALVARDIKMKPKEIEAALAKVESAGGDVIELAQEAVKSACESGRLKGRVLDVFINSEEPKHVVMYVRWQGSKGADAVKDASTLAAIVAKEAPLVSTLSLAAIHPKAAKSSKEPVWSAKIGSAAMSRIQEKRIDDYADRLYKSLFEGIEEKPF